MFFSGVYASEKMPKMIDPMPNEAAPLFDHIFGVKGKHLYGFYSYIECSDNPLKDWYYVYNNQQQGVAIILYSKEGQKMVAYKEVNPSVETYMLIELVGKAIDLQRSSNINIQS